MRAISMCRYILAPLLVHGGALAQEVKITASSPQEHDLFGSAVSLNGEYALVGTRLEDDKGTDAGAAYMFQRTGIEWPQVAKLTASDAQAYDMFGYAVALSGDDVLVGAPQEDAGGSDAGAAYLFRRTVFGWAEVAKITASDAQSDAQFGASVALWGDFALVGAYRQDSVGANDAGAAYVFQRNAYGWSQVAILTANDAEASDFFGYSVALSGDYALVGAYLVDTRGTNAGAAYLFKRTEIDWTQVAKFTASNAQASDYFGCSVAINEDYAVVGAKQEFIGGLPGTVYVYEYTDTSWAEVAALQASDTQAGELFGGSVALTGDHVLIGATKAKRQNPQDVTIVGGAAYLFLRTDEGWMQTTKLTASDGSVGDDFGNAVALTGSHALVGAYLVHPSGVNNAGAAYVYDLPPDPPTRIIAVADDGQVTLSWSTNSEADLSHYIVYQSVTASFTPTSADSVAFVNKPDTSVTIQGLSNGTVYYFRVAAADNVGTLSQPSEEVSGVPVGLVAYWPFNGNATDMSGNGYDGTVSGATLRADRFGAASSAYAFDGVDDYIHVPAGGQLSFDASSQSYTVSLFFLVDSLDTSNGNLHLIFDREIGTSSWFSYDLSVVSEPGNTNYQHVANDIWNGGYSGHMVVSQDTISLKQWHYVALVVNAGTSQALYVDGTVQGTFDITGISNTKGNTGGITIGAGQLPDGVQVHNGLVDDTRVYNRALTDSDIWALFAEGGWNPPPATPKLLAATPGDRQVSLIWLVATELDLASYYLYRHTARDSTLATRLDTLFRTDTSTTDINLTNDITYWYWLSAVDSAGNESKLSEGRSVTPVNYPPQIASADSVVATEDLYFVYYATATDLEGAILSFTFDQLPTWLSAQADSVYGTPREGALDTSFRIVVSDGYLTDTLIVTVIILPVNDPPNPFALLVPADGDTAEIENDSLLFVWESSTDIEGDTLVYHFHIYGPGYDSTITGLTDTSLVLTGMAALTLDSLYTWYVDVLDGTDTTSCLADYQFRMPSVLGVDPLALIPQEFALHQNYPNPFNPSTTIQFDLPMATDVHLAVYDLLGREVAHLADGRLEAGYHSLIWNGKDAWGREVPTGLYIARLVTASYTKSIKLVLLK